MRSTLAIRFALCGVLGLVTTVVVAWGCAAFSPPLVPNLRYAEFDHTLLEGWPIPPGESSPRAIDTTPGFGVGAVHLHYFNIGWGFESHVVGVHTGWPWAALRCRTDRHPPADLNAAGWSGGTLRKRGLGPTTRVRLLKGTMDVDCPLPVEPYWPGLLANTGLYSLIWALPLVLPVLGQRIHRKNRGVCLGCGYDVAGLAACPECGAEAGPA